MEDLSKKYQVKDEISHILDRAGMWVGSTITENITAPIYFPSVNMLKVKDIPFNQALNKLIDEVFSNSVDEYRRSKQTKKDCLFDITKITMEVNTNGHIVIEDNGGIPVQKHSETGMYIPYMIFGLLRTSSNYDDSREREVVGTNGLGAKLTNIFSKSFRVETCDGKNIFDCEWKDNMHNFEMKDIKPCKNHFTRITFDIDLSRFKDNGSEDSVIDTGTIRLLQKRCIDTAASNPGLEIEFKSDDHGGVMNSLWKFKSFRDYVDLFIDKNPDSDTKQILPENIVEWRKGKDSVYLVFTDRGCTIPNIGFVNGVECSQGSHIKKIQTQVVAKMLELCKKSNMDVITEKDILSCFSVFVNCTIINPQYDSQAKTKLTNKIDKLQLQFDDKFLNDLKKGGLFEILKDFYDVKYKEQKKRELRKLNSTIKSTKIKKQITPGIVDVERNELFIFEGNSAAGGFRKCRNVYQSAYLLRGKIKNTLNLNRSEILENQELRELLAILRLSFGDPKGNLKNLSMNKIIFCTDMDYDGHHICGLLITFFKKHFPELFAAHKIYRALSPIIIAEKGKDVKYFYSMDDYEREKENYKGYNFRYTKGLGGLETRDYHEMLNNQKLVEFYADSNTDDTINVWFDKSTEIRKSILMAENSDESD